MFLGSYECRCLKTYRRYGKTCLPEPDKPVNLLVTVLDITKAKITWSVANLSRIAWYRVEYKAWGIHKERWQVGRSIYAPNATSVLLRGLIPEATYMVRVGAFSNQNISSYSAEEWFYTPMQKKPTKTRSGGDGRKSTVIVTALIGAVFVLVVVACFLLYWIRKRKKKNKKKSETSNRMEDLIELRVRPTAPQGATEQREPKENAKGNGI